MHVIKKLTFKIHLFISCILKINNTLVNNVKDLDVVMSMYNLIECSKNYSKATEILWNYYRYETNSGAVRDENYSIKDSKFFDYKADTPGRLEGNNAEKENVKIAVSLKYLSNF